jgi:uncharacterized membrane protein HdeD (DUF308 family)
MSLTALVQNWWMMAIRGVLAVSLGVALTVWPGLTLSNVVVFFGLYAIIDGAWSIAAGLRATARVLDTWPVVLEGAVSVVLGVTAIVWPFLPRGFIYLLAAWGVITGVLELTAARRLPRTSRAHWLLATAGLSSLFLAVVVALLPHADEHLITRAIAVYAEIFGVGLFGAALSFPQQVASSLPSHATARPAR